jgi:hypothetical protein
MSRWNYWQALGKMLTTFPFQQEEFDLIQAAVGSKMAIELLQGERRGNCMRPAIWLNINVVQAKT